MKKEKKEQVVKDEHEKRFLLPNIPPEIFYGIQNRTFRTEEIKQGYAQNNGGRFRKTTTPDGQVKYEYTEKEKIPGSKGLSKKEITTTISETEFKDYLKKIDGELIQKTRYYISIGKYILEINMFHERLEGQVLGEIEFPSEKEAIDFQKPDWMGREVTNEINNRALSLGVNIPQK